MDRPVERKFLGFSFTANGQKRRIAPKAIVRFKRKVRELTCRTRGMSLEQMTKELADYLRGWKAYFGFCQTPSVLGTLDQWLWRRLRAVIWKPLKRGTMRYRKLWERGVKRDLAAHAAGNSRATMAYSQQSRNVYRVSCGLLRLDRSSADVDRDLA